MRYKANDNSYQGGKYYKKDVEYKPEELPPGLTTDELEALFEARGIPDGRRTPSESSDDLLISGTEDEGGIVLRDPDAQEAEHTILIEYAHEHGINAAANWKPATIIRKLEETGVDVTQFAGKFQE